MTIGGAGALTTPSSGIVTWKSDSSFEQIGLERLVGAVDLVDQQHRRAARRAAPAPAAAGGGSDSGRRKCRARCGRGRARRPPRRGGSPSSARDSSTRRRRWRRRGPRSIAGGSACGRARRRAPWRSPSCRRRPRLRAGAAGRAAGRGTPRSPARARRHSPRRAEQRERFVDRSGKAAVDRSLGIPDASLRTTNALRHRPEGAVRQPHRRSLRSARRRHRAPGHHADEMGAIVGVAVQVGDACSPASDLDRP